MSVEVIAVAVLFVAPAVIGALVYAAGVRRRKRLLRVSGIAIIFGPLVTLSVLIALTGGE